MVTTARFAFCSSETETETETEWQFPANEHHQETGKNHNDRPH